MSLSSNEDAHGTICVVKFTERLIQMKTVETAAVDDKSELNCREPHREMLEVEVTSSFILYVHSTEPWLNNKPRSKNDFLSEFKVATTSPGMLGTSFPSN